MYALVRHNANTNKLVRIEPKKTYDTYESAINELVKRVHDKKLERLLPSNFNDLSIETKEHCCSELLNIGVSSLETIKEFNSFVA